MKFNDIQKKHAIIGASAVATVIVTRNVIKNIKRKREARILSEELADLIDELCELSYNCSKLAEENQFLRNQYTNCKH